MINGNVNCLVCDHGFPNSYYDSCIAFTDPPTKEQTNCIFGTRIGAEEGVRCGKCENGFAVDLGYCKPNSPDFEGCMQISPEGNYCAFCNADDGFFSMSNLSNKCIKMPF